MPDFGFGLSEFLLILVLAVFLVGPEEIPKVMMTLGRIARRISYVKYAFSQQFEEFLRDAELADIRKQVNFEDGKKERKHETEEEDFDESAGDLAAQDWDVSEPDAEREEETPVRAKAAGTGNKKASGKTAKKGKAV